MVYLPTGKPWLPRQLPLEPVVIDRKNTFGRSFSFGIYRSARNLFNNELGTLSGGQFLRGGTLLDVSGGTEYLDFPNYNPNIADGFIFTLRVQGQTTTYQEYQRILSTKTVWNGTDGFEINSDAGTNPSDVEILLNGGESAVLTGYSNYLDWRYITLAYNANASEIYYLIGDGAVNTLSVTTALTNGTSGITLAQNAALNESNGEYIYEHLFMCEGNFGPGAVQNLHYNPFQVLKPANGNVYFIPSAAPAPSVNPQLMLTGVGS